MRVSIEPDGEGFLSQECPACHKLFKVVFGEGSDRPISYCPYCGHREEGCWWTREQADYFAGMVGEEEVKPMLQKFARDIKRMNRAGSFIKFDAKVRMRKAPSPPMETEATMPIAEFKCCGERVKHDGSKKKLHCPICGRSTST